MFKLGLKLWSINTDIYLNEAIKLYKNKIYDYIELYVVPNSSDTLQNWELLKKEFNIPFIIHCSHFAHGFNLAQKSFKKTNLEIYKEAKKFADTMNSKFIIFHGGLDGNITETAKQLKSFAEPRSLIENKPYKALNNKMNGQFCRGATIEEIDYILNEVKCGFCLDIGHAICSANSQNVEPYEYINKFNKLKPLYYHLSDNLIDSELDKHLHIGEGNYNIKRIANILNENKYLALETNKDSNENLNDFKEDIKCLKSFI